MRFFNLGASEFLLIFLFAILAIGPKETIRLAGQARDIIKSLQSAISELSSGVAHIAEEVLEEPKDEESNP